jgi:hypothetical protein
MPDPSSVPPAGPYDDILAAALRELESRGKIQLIKVLRERTGLALKPAKDVVEDYGRRHAIQWKPYGPGCAVCVVLAFFALTAAALTAI